MKLNRSPIIIGLTGANGAGKDTAASMLAGVLRNYGIQSATLAFADALYEEVAAAFGVTVKGLKSRVWKEEPQGHLALEFCKAKPFVDAMASKVPIDAWLSPRQILQYWGTEYRRTQQPDYWVQRLQAKVQELHAAGILDVVITDVRFADEAAALRAMGGQIWRIDRPNLVAASTGHVSEVSGQEFQPEATIRNEGSLDLLRHTCHQTLLRTAATQAKATPCPN